MTNWNLQSNDPGSFSIASDARFIPTSYTDDHIWSLSLEGGEPPALAIQTTFGLRTKNFRLFPRIIEGDRSFMDPMEFSSKPSVRRFFPNYLEVIFSPLEGLDVSSEYWVPTSNVLMGRVTVKNSRLIHRRLILQWVALLNPTMGGQRMAPQYTDSVKFLNGETENLHPVLSMVGNAEFTTGPYPALSISSDLSPGDSFQTIWIQAASDSIEGSLEIIKKNMVREWEAEIAAIEVMNEGQVKIVTGNPDWNAALALAQNTALKLIMGPTKNLSKLSFILNREPDQGFSHLGDGLDYNYLWNGQNAFDADYLSTFLLLPNSELVKNILGNFLDTQTSNGFINYNVGLGGQKSKMLATPILVNLAWRLYLVTEDLNYLKKVFPKLLNFIHCWFTPKQDRDRDGIPEWERASQSGFEDNPLFTHLDPEFLGAEISKTETPSLCSFLSNEILLLIRMANLLGETSPIAALEALAENLKTAVETAWDPHKQIYQNWDRETHICSQGEILGSRRGSGEINIHQKFNEPVRLVLQIKMGNEPRKNIRIFIHGVSTSGNQRIERIEADQFTWHIYQANVTSERVYSSIEHIEVDGTDYEDTTTVGIMDLSRVDQTLLLPLWAGLPDKERAEALIEKTILDSEKFWKPFGIPACPWENGQENLSYSMTHMPWNNLIGEALLRYGYRDQAADLVTRLMDCVVINLKKYQSFFNFYNPTTGNGFGERNTLRGLVPLNLFIETLGIRIVSPFKVYLQGKNPFPWPVTIYFKGLTITRDFHKTAISFPGGQTAVVKSDEPRMIEVKENSD